MSKRGETNKNGEMFVLWCGRNFRWIGPKREIEREREREYHEMRKDENLKNRREGYDKREFK